MSDDFTRLVEQARDRSVKFTPDWPNTARLLAGLADAVERQWTDLAECYRLTGADPDGNGDWRLAPHAVREVARLRREADEDSERVAALKAKAAEVLRWREGDLPAFGYLRDTDKSREALADLAALVDGTEATS